MNKTASSPLYELFAVERLNGIDATQEDKRLYGTDADDSWLVLGNVTSGNGHSLIVDLQEGNDSFRVFGNMESSGGGRTLLDFSGNSTITVSGNVVADGGRNYLRNYWGDNTINIAGRLSATGGGSNMIEMDEVERGSIRIDKGIEATGSSYNNIACGMIGSSEYSTISIDGISASDNSRNSLHFTGDNQGNYSMDLTKGVSAVGGSTNYLEFYQCSHAELDINGSVNSMEGGNTTFQFSNDRTDFTLYRTLATHHPSNTLHFAG